MTRFMIVLFRGLSLFKKYFKAYITSIIALVGLYTAIHSVFAFQNSVSEYSQEAFRYDKIRVYSTLRDSSEINELKEQLVNLPDSPTVIEIAPEDVKAILMKDVKDSSGIKKLPSSFFPVMFELIYNLSDVDPLSFLEEEAAQIKKLDGVYKVFTGDEFAGKLINAKLGLKKIFNFMILLFAAASAGVMYQTIRLGLLRYGREIKIYKLVGGTNMFILMPFVILSVALSVFSSVVSYGVFYLLHKFFLIKVELLTGLAMKLNLVYIVSFTFFVCFVSAFAAVLSSYYFLSRSNSINEV